MFWYDIKDDDKAGQKKVANLMFEAVDWIDKRNKYNSERNFFNYQLYNNGVPWKTNFYGSAGSYSGFGGQNSFVINMEQRICDSLTAKISKKKPRTYFLTKGDDHDKSRSAKKLNGFTLGENVRLDTYTKTSKAFLSGCVFGNGIIKVYPDFQKRKVQSENVFVGEIKVDELEALFCPPRTLYQVKMVGKHHLVGMFPEYEEQIMMASTTGVKGSFYPTDSKDLVKVVEGWRLPGVGPGKHAIAIENCTMMIEDYTKEVFPFVKYDFRENLMGYWSKGVVDLTSRHQAELNRMIRRASNSFWMGSVPRVLVEASSKIIDAHINNEVGAITKYQGTPPQFTLPPAVDPMLLNWINFLVSSALEEIGLSEMSSSSKVPTNFRSGKAIDTFHDIETERFAKLAQRYEKFHIDYDRLVISAAKDIAKKSGDYAVLSPDKNGVEEIKWSEINLEDDAYIMQPYPTSLLPEEPAGKLNYVQQLMESGIIDRNESGYLLDYPDTDKIMKLRNADIDDIERVIAKIIDDGEYNRPEKYQNLRQGMKMVQQAYLYYKNRGLDEIRRAMFVQWLSDAEKILLGEQQRAMMMQQAQMAQAQAELSQQMPPEVAQQVSGAGTVQAELMQGNIPQEGAMV